MKRTEDWVAKGIAGLRAQAMPEAPVGLAEKMLDERSPTKSRSAARFWALAACGGLGVALFALVPQRSSAAITLDRLVTAQADSPGLFHVTPYWIVGKSRTPKIWHGYVKGDRWHYIQADFEQACDGRQVMSYWPKEGKAQVWTRSETEVPEAVLGGASLSWWRSADRKGLKFQHDLVWNGRKVDRYEITTTSQAWGATKNVLYADPVANRPLYAEHTHASGNGNAIAWDYPDSSDDSVLRIRLRPGTKVEDVTAQRERDRQRNLGLPDAPAKASVRD